MKGIVDNLTIKKKKNRFLIKHMEKNKGMYNKTNTKIIRTYQMNICKLFHPTI